MPSLHRLIALKAAAVGLGNPIGRGSCSTRSSLTRRGGRLSRQKGFRLGQKGRGQVKGDKPNHGRACQKPPFEFFTLVWVEKSMPGVEFDTNGASRTKQMRPYRRPWLAGFEVGGLISRTLKGGPCSVR